MPGQLISPNLHVILIHYPLAMLIAGTLIELFSFLWRKSSFRVAGRWMILIGALSTIPATFSGIYALRDISRISVDQDMRWADLKAASPVFSQPQIWEKLRNHMLYQSIATGMASLLVVIWLGASNRIRKSKLFHLTLLLMLMVTVAIIIRAAWFGGEAIYKNGVGVEAVFPTIAPASEPSTQPISWTNTPTRAERMFPPLELHAVMAGVFTAIALVAIGLSFRKIAARELLPEHKPIVTGDPATAFNTPRPPPSSFEMVRTFNPHLEVEIKPFAPAGRFWMLASLLALLTFAGGLFVIARGSDVFSQMHGQPKLIPLLLWDQIKPIKITRLFIHFAAGSAIVVLPIILALLSRFAPRERIILTLVTLLLSCAVAAQVWLGILLLFDTSEGPVNHFNPSAADVRSAAG
jgi:uncharacterized membrane protein